MQVIPYTKEEIVEEIENLLQLNIKERDKYEQILEDMKHGTYREGVLYPVNASELYHDCCGACSVLGYLLYNIEHKLLKCEDPRKYE